MEPTEYLTVKQAAHELGMSPEAILTRLRRGVMQGVRVWYNGYLGWRIPRAEVARWRDVEHRPPLPRRRKVCPPLC